MNIEVLHNICKVETRKAFEWYKQTAFITIDKPLTLELSIHNSYWLIIDFGTSLIGKLEKKLNLSSQQIIYCIDVVNQYKALLKKTCDAYATKHLPL